MFDQDLEQRLQSGGRLTSAGIFVLVASFFGTCVAAMGKASGKGDVTASGFELGQSPWLALGLAAGVALIAFGQARKANARNEAARRLRDANTTNKTVLDPTVAEGPFRGATKHVPVVDPSFQAYEQAERDADHRRGSTYLFIGASIILVTVAGVIWGMSSGGSTKQKIDSILMSFGLGVIPFGFGLFFTIKGALLRNK
jgi:hypothetical protein